MRAKADSRYQSTIRIGSYGRDANQVQLGARMCWQPITMNIGKLASDKKSTISRLLGETNLGVAGTLSSIHDTVMTESDEEATTLESTLGEGSQPFTSEGCVTKALPYHERMTDKAKIARKTRVDEAIAGKAYG